MDMASKPSSVQDRRLISRNGFVRNGQLPITLGPVQGLFVSVEPVRKTHLGGILIS